ncbi:MAG: type II toxin-antitoxin system VapC family toxin [Planctomycetaceae bacterium]
MSYLLDTDTCSAYLKGNRTVWQKFMQYAGRLHISAVTAGELFVWGFRAKGTAAKRQSVFDLMSDMTFLPVDRDISQRFGEVRAAQLDQGRTTPTLDLFVAATALVHSLTLVTHNVSDFVTIPTLSIEDWLVP